MMLSAPLVPGNRAPNYSLRSERLRSDKWVIARLPEGYEIKAEAFKREEGVLLIGGAHYTQDYAVVSLLDPKHNRRIRATVAVDSFKMLQPSTQEPLPHL